MSNGVCEHWSTWVDGTLDAANKSVVTITPGTSSAAVSAIACSSAGWYKDTTNLICVKCYAGCATCSDYTSSTARLDECLTADTTVNTMYMSSNTPTTCVASNVATCSSATEILSCTADTHALLYTYAGTTAGVYDGAITKSCTGVSNGVGGVADATCAHAYVNGATGTGLPNKKCSKCISTAATLVLTYASAIGTGDITYTCAATSTTDTQEKYGCT